MKKSILIVCTVLTTFSLTAFGFINWSNPKTDKEETTCSKTVAFDNEFLYTLNTKAKFDLFYNVSSRYIATITKEKLYQAKSIIDLVPKESTKGIKLFRDVKIRILYEDGEKFEKGNGSILNSAQLNLLQSTNYSTNFCIEAYCKRKNPDTGRTEDQRFIYYITIVPEKEAEFNNGHDALIKYIKENSKEKTAIINQYKLQPGKVSFTITKKGKIENVKLTSTSGYTSVDEALVELITNVPGKWNPATNSKGEKVDQELVFFFGLEGC